VIKYETGSSPHRGRKERCTSNSMIYLIIGSVVTLAGVGLIVSKISLPGIILLIVGVAMVRKGRREIDKKRL
jgi:hypothetical protein